MAVLAKLGDFRGDSRFTTWAYKFALLEAGVKVRRRAWQGREVPLAPEGWAAIAAGPVARRDAETAELLGAIREAINNDLSPRQREVLVAVALDGVPIDVLAERLGHDAGSALQDHPRRPREAAGRVGGAMPMTARRTIDKLLGPAGPELTCEQCFEELDRYVELELSGADAEAQVPGMSAHLEGCPACEEDHQSLLALVAAD